MSSILSPVVGLVVALCTGLVLWRGSLLIVVGVAMDTVNQVESQLIMRHYDGFTPRSGRVRGRRGW